jgi:hypothetical protein
MYMVDSYIFRNYEATLATVSLIYSTLVPTLSKTLYTFVVKFLASTSDHIAKALCQFVITCKMASK